MLPFATNNKGPVVEIDETRYPILYEEYSLLRDSAGPGKYRGGVGSRLVWKLRAKECQLSCLAERHRISPYGVFGGLPPVPRECGHFSDTLLRIGTKTDFAHATELFGKLSPSKWSNITIHEGDSVEIVLSGGGGWGPPNEREPEAVVSDVISGFVSMGAAKDVYGIVLDAKKMTIDLEATERLREKMKTSGPKLQLRPHVKMLQSLEIRCDSNAKPRPIDVDGMPGLVSISEQRQGFVVKVEASSYEELVSRIRNLTKTLDAEAIRVLATQFVPLEFRPP